jgi:glycosyltransferase involved in cell wall biosynthesis
MMRTVAINEAILRRGASGTARAARLIRAGIAELEGYSVTGVQPTRARGRSKLLNAASDLRWDLRGAASAARGAEILVSPCNIGRSGRGQAHVLLVCDVMLWEHPGLFDRAFGRYARTLIPYSMRHADITWTLSDHARAHLTRLVPGANVRVLRLPALPGRPDLPGGPSSRRTVLMLGETALHKNHLGGIDAVVRARASSGEDLALRLIGPAGNAESAVLRQLAEVDPDGRWTSREVGRSDDEVDEALGSAWLLLQPSVNEGYGLPLIEAAQRGLPVVHTGAGAMAEVLPDSSVGSTDARALADGIVALLDPDRLATSVSAASSALTRISWESFSDELAAALGTLDRG